MLELFLFSLIFSRFLLSSCEMIHEGDHASFPSARFLCTWWFVEGTHLLYVQLSSFPDFCRSEAIEGSYESFNMGGSQENFLVVSFTKFRRLSLHSPGLGGYFLLSVRSGFENFGRSDLEWIPDAICTRQDSSKLKMERIRVMLFVYRFCPSMVCYRKSKSHWKWLTKI